MHDPTTPDRQGNDRVRNTGRQFCNERGRSAKRACSRRTRSRSHLERPGRNRNTACGRLLPGRTVSSGLSGKTPRRVLSCGSFTRKETAGLIVFLTAKTCVPYTEVVGVAASYHTDPGMALYDHKKTVRSEPRAFVLRLDA